MLFRIKSNVCSNVPNIICKYTTYIHHPDKSGMSLRGIVINVLDCDLVISEFELIPLGKAWTPDLPQLWDK